MIFASRETRTVKLARKEMMAKGPTPPPARPQPRP